MIHVSFIIQYSDTDFEKAFTKSWIDGLVYYYERFYNFDEKTEDEKRLVNEWSKRLQETTPTQYLIGCHLVAPKAAFMGEDIWIVDRIPQHSLQFQHIPCGRYAVLRREDRLWCGVCACAIPEEELRE